MCYALPHIPGRGWVTGEGLLGLCVAAIALLRARRSNRWIWRFAPLLAVALLAQAWCLWQLADWQALRWHDGRVEKQRVEARIVSIPVRSGADVQMLAEIRSRDGGPWRRVQVRWSDAPDVHAAQRWQWLLELRAARGWLNPGSRDREREFLRQRIHALGVVRPSALNRLLTQGSSLDAWRERIARRLRSLVVERDSAALLIALAVGDTQHVSIEQWRIFNACGITHLVAISGLHVTLFCLLVARAARLLWQRVGWLRGYCAQDRFSLSLGWSASAGYALLAGWSVPTQRTLLMLAAWHGARLMRRAPGAMPSWSLALLAVLALDPMAPLAAGFWLSFLAVGVLIAGGMLRRGAHADGPAWREVLELMRTQWRISVALIPCTLAIFGAFAPLSYAVNLIAIPFFSLLLVPLLLIACALDSWPNACAALLIRASAWCAQHFWPLLHAVASVEWASVPVRAPAWWYALAAFGTVLLLLPIGWRLQTGAWLVSLPLLAPRATALVAGECRIDVLEVGRGEAIVVRTVHHTLLFDDGESWNSRGRVASGPVLAALRDAGRRRIDVAILPRVDPDRAQGLAALGASLQLGELRTADVGNGVPPEFGRCEPRSWKWDGVRLELLDAAGDCALRITSAGAAVLIGGQLQPAAWRNGAISSLPIYALVAPRHGSAAAWAPEQAAGVPYRVLISQERLAVATRALSESLGRWRHAGSRTHVTGLEGALAVRLAPDRAPSLQAERRARAARVWRWPAIDAQPISRDADTGPAAAGPSGIIDGWQ